MPLGNPITIRFEEDELEALKEKAREDRRPVGFVVREAVRAFCLPRDGRDATHNGQSATNGLGPVSGQTPINGNAARVGVSSSNEQGATDRA